MHCAATKSTYCVHIFVNKAADTYLVQCPSRHTSNLSPDITKSWCSEEDNQRYWKRMEYSKCTRYYATVTLNRLSLSEIFSNTRTVLPLFPPLCSPLFFSLSQTNLNHVLFICCLKITYIVQLITYYVSVLNAHIEH